MSFSFGGRLPLEVVFHRRSSSIVGCPPLEVVFHWKLSSIWGHFPLEVVFHWRSSSFQAIWFSPLSISLKFEEDPISDCRDIPLWIFWGHLPLKVIYISSNIKFWFRLSLKFEEDRIIGYWDIPLLFFLTLPWMSSSLHSIINFGLVP
jgi:hypothetical protein